MGRRQRVDGGRGPGHSGRGSDLGTAAEDGSGHSGRGQIWAQRQRAGGRGRFWAQRQRSSGHSGRGLAAEGGWSRATAVGAERLGSNSVAGVELGCWGASEQLAGGRRICGGRRIWEDGDAGGLDLGRRRQGQLGEGWRRRGSLEGRGWAAEQIGGVVGAGTLGSNSGVGF